MASSRALTKDKCQHHKSAARSKVEEDEKRSFSSKIGWLCTKTFQFTFGACCYGPIVAFLSLCRACDLSAQVPAGDEELMGYACYEQPDSKSEEDQQWKRRTQILKADTRIKQRLRYQFQDHIQKWMDIKHRRFPWKATLHVLLMILVTIQVSLQIPIIVVQHVASKRFGRS